MSSIENSSIEKSGTAKEGGGERTSADPSTRSAPDLINSLDLDIPAAAKGHRQSNKAVRKTIRRLRYVRSVLPRFGQRVAAHGHMLRSIWAKPGTETAGDIDISILCPTRGRPADMAKIWHSALQKASRPERIEIVFYLDNDDTLGLSGLALCATQRASQVRALIGNRIVLSQCWNAACEHARGDIFMQCGDDILFRSNDWDVFLIDAFAKVEDRIAFVYGRDGQYDQLLGTHGFLHRNWVETLGYFVPPIFSSDYNDVWLHEVAVRIQREVFVPEIYTEHLHFKNNKRTLDTTYKERLLRHKQDQVSTIWENTVTERIRDAKKLRAYIEQQAAKRG